MRFTLGPTPLIQGIDLLAVAVGLFGIAEVLAIAADPHVPRLVERVGLRSLLPDREEARRSVGPILRGSGLGSFVGLVPGPALFTTRADIFWAFVAAMYVGNLMLLALNLPLVGLFARIATLRPQVLMPVVGVLCLVGAYSARSSLFDVWVMLIAGTAGFWLRRWGFPPAPLAIGMVLGPMTEQSLRLTMQTLDGDLTRMLSRPLAMIFLVAAVLFQAFVFRRARLRLAAAPEGAR